MSACRDCPIPSNRPRLWKRVGIVKESHICERQLNEARRYRGNFMSFFDDLPPALPPTQCWGKSYGRKPGMLWPASID